MINLINLEKKYDGFHLNLSMEIPAGRITGLVGKNGSGKSTVIKSILGLISPTAGSVKVFGAEACMLTADQRQDIGAALAESGFSEYLSASDAAKILAAMYSGFDAAEFLSRCKEQGLDAKKLIKDYSTGMKAKLRVLVALSHKAKLLILDEPTAGLDIEARIDILDMLRSYMAEDEERTMLITSHIASDLESLCDDIYLISKGKLLLHEDTDRILSQYGVLKLDEAGFALLSQKGDEKYLLGRRKTTYGWECLTSERQYFAENYPGLVAERAGIDDFILMLTE